MTPGTYNWSIVRGTTDPFIFRLMNTEVPPAPISVDDVRITFNKKSTFLFRVTLSDGDIINNDPLNGEFTFTPTPEQSRMFPEGAKTSYELEVWFGTSQLVYLMGTVTGIGGINDDVEVIP